jgi:hypothetical protein
MEEQTTSKTVNHLEEELDMFIGRDYDNDMQIDEYMD